MLLALNLAKKHIGSTLQNPCVGCVIVKNNIILATGVTARNGRPHAEDIAINNAKQDISKATIYVTLEPCFHIGQTNPCVDLIISKKIARVVIACKDPDSRVNGKGIKKLEASNIKTQIGLFEKEAQEINRGFFKSKTKNQPFITLKLATSLDGKIATKTFDSKWITNEISRKYGHYLRAKNDAILIGANSIRKDNPSLNCRIEGLEDLSPIKIILSNSLDLDLNNKIFNENNIKTYIATNNKNKDKHKKFIKNNINIILFKNLKDLLSKLCKIGINNLLIEGGSNTSTNFLKEGLIDEIVHFQGNQLLGNDSIGAISNLDLNLLQESSKFKKISSKNLEGDQLTILRK